MANDSFLNMTNTLQQTAAKSPRNAELLATEARNSALAEAQKPSNLSKPGNIGSRLRQLRRKTEPYIRSASMIKKTSAECGAREQVVREAQRMEGQGYKDIGERLRKMRRGQIKKSAVRLVMAKLAGLKIKGTSPWANPGYQPPATNNVAATMPDHMNPTAAKPMPKRVPQIKTPSTMPMKPMQPMQPAKMASTAPNILSVSGNTLRGIRRLNPDSGLSNVRVTKSDPASRLRAIRQSGVQPSGEELRSIRRSIQQPMQPMKMSQAQDPYSADFSHIQNQIDAALQRRNDALEFAKMKPSYLGKLGPQVPSLREVRQTSDKLFADAAVAKSTLIQRVMEARNRALAVAKKPANLSQPGNMGSALRKLRRVTEKYMPPKEGSVKTAGKGAAVMKILKALGILGAGAGTGYAAAKSQQAGGMLGKVDTNVNQAITDIPKTIDTRMGQVTDPLARSAKKLEESIPVAGAALKETGKTVGVGALSGIGTSALANLLIPHANYNRMDPDAAYRKRARREAIIKMLGLGGAAVGGLTYMNRGTAVPAIKGLGSKLIGKAKSVLK